MLLMTVLLPVIGNASIRTFVVTNTSYVVLNADGIPNSVPGSLAAAVDSVNKYSTDSCKILFDLKATDTIRVNEKMPKAIKNSKYICIDGGKVKTKISLYNSCFTISSSKNVVLKNLDFVEGTNGLDSPYLLESCSVDSIFNCDFHDLNFGLGLSYTSVSYCGNCTFSNNETGLYFGPSCSAYVDNCTFTSNNFGVRGTTSKIELNKCTFTDNSDGLQSFSGKAYGCVFSKNEVASNTGSSPSFYRCEFYDNTELALRGAKIVDNCTFTGNKRAFEPYGGTTDSIVSCKFIKNNEGIFQNGGGTINYCGENEITGNTGVGISVNGYFNYILNNNISDNAIGIEIPASSSVKSITGNTISGNKGAGISIKSGRGSIDLISNNYIGTTSDWKVKPNGGDGIYIGSTSTIPKEIKGNVIGNNVGNGINLDGANNPSVNLSSNYIGVTPDSKPIPNGQDGVRINTINSNITIDNCEIGYNKGAGVRDLKTGTLNVKNSSIFENESYGVFKESDSYPYILDIIACEFNGNDSSAVYSNPPASNKTTISQTTFLNSEPNEIQNYAIENVRSVLVPVISSVTKSGSEELFVRGKVDTTAKVLVEIFLSDGIETATKYLASDSTDAKGNFKIYVKTPLQKGSITATASYSIGTTTHMTSGLADPKDFDFCYSSVEPVIIRDTVLVGGTFKGVKYSKIGLVSFSDTLVASSGCDSIVLHQLFVMPNKSEAYYVKEKGQGNGSSWDDPLGQKEFDFVLKTLSTDNVTFYLAEGIYHPVYRKSDFVETDNSSASWSTSHPVKIIGGFSKKSTGKVKSTDVPDGIAFPTLLSGDFKNDTYVELSGDCAFYFQKTSDDVSGSLLNIDMSSTGGETMLSNLRFTGVRNPNGAPRVINAKGNSAKKSSLSLYKCEFFNSEQAINSQDVTNLNVEECEFNFILNRAIYSNATCIINKSTFNHSYLDIHDSEELIITNSTFVSNMNDISSSSKVNKIYNNTFVGCDGSGLSTVQASKSNYVYGNIFAGSNFSFESKGTQDISNNVVAGDFGDVTLNKSNIITDRETLFDGILDVEYSAENGVAHPNLSEKNGSHYVALLTDKIGSQSLRFSRLDDVSNDKIGNDRLPNTCMGAYEMGCLPVTTFQYDTIIVGTKPAFKDSIYNNVGRYENVYEVINVNGCDSIVNHTLFVKPNPTTLNYYVKMNRSLKGDGSDWENAMNGEDFAAVLPLAPDGAVFYVAEGDYSPKCNSEGAPTSPGWALYSVNSSVKILGGYPDTATLGAKADPSRFKTTFLSEDEKGNQRLFTQESTDAKTLSLDGLYFYNSAWAVNWKNGDVEISNCNFDNSGINFGNADLISVKHCHISNIKYPFEFKGSVDHILIDDVETENIESQFLYLYSSYGKYGDVLLSHVKSQNAIYVNSCDSISIVDCSFVNEKSYFCGVDVSANGMNIKNTTISGFSSAIGGYGGVGNLYLKNDTLISDGKGVTLNCAYIKNLYAYDSKIYNGITGISIINGGGQATIENCVVSGNSECGIDVKTGTAVLRNNIIGLKDNESESWSNKIGVRVSDCSSLIIDGNIISGNDEVGLSLSCSPIKYSIINNFIGTNRKIQDFGNGTDGISISVRNGAVSINPSSYKEANYIGFNKGNGISTYNYDSEITHNYIGVSPDGKSMPNGKYGISSNTGRGKLHVIENHFGFNLKGDINEALGEIISKNWFHGNENLAIDTFGVNSNLKVKKITPQILSVEKTSDAIMVSGKIDTGLVSTIELFYSEGVPQTAFNYLVSTQTDKNGEFKAEIPFAVFPEGIQNMCVVSTATCYYGGDSLTSMLSDPFCCKQCMCSPVVTEIHDTVKFGGTYKFNDKNLNDICSKVGSHIVSDTLTSVEGCDSIVILSLVVRPEKYEYYVKENGTGDGSDWDNAMNGDDFAAVLPLAPDGATFYVAEGSYNPGRDYSKNSEGVYVPKPASKITIIGGYIADAKTGAKPEPKKYETIFRSVEKSDMCLSVSSSKVYGIVFESPVFVTFAYEQVRKSSFDKCTFRGISECKYAVYHYQTSESVIDFNECVFSKNKTKLLGGYQTPYNVGTDMYYNCTFEENEADDLFGFPGLFKGDLYYSFENCTFYNNQAKNFFYYYGGLRLYNCSFFNNKATTFLYDRSSDSCEPSALIGNAFVKNEFTSFQEGSGRTTSSVYFNAVANNLFQPGFTESVPNNIYLSDKADLENGLYESDAKGVAVLKDNGGFTKTVALNNDKLADGTSIRFPLDETKVTNDQRGVIRFENTCMGAYEIACTNDTITAIDTILVGKKFKDGKTYDKEGSFEGIVLTTRKEDGCDSVIIYTLHVISPSSVDPCSNDTTFATDTIFVKSEFKDGNTYNNPGRYENIYVNYSSKYGCDSVVNYTLIVKPDPKILNYYVKINREGTGDGSRWEDAMNGEDFAAVLPYAPDGATFYIAEGEYSPVYDGSGYISNYAYYDVNNSVSIYGGYSADAVTGAISNPNLYKTILGSQNSSIGLFFSNEENLLNIKIDGVYVNDYQSTVVYMQNADVTLSNCHFNGNDRVVYVSNEGSLNVTHSEVNKTNSNAFYVYVTKSVYMDDVKFTDNKINPVSTYGSDYNVVMKNVLANNNEGGFQFYGSKDLLVENSKFNSNTTSGYLLETSGAVDVENCIFADNNASRVISSYLNYVDNNVTINKSTFSNNISPYVIYAAGPELPNCTITESSFSDNNGIEILNLSSGAKDIIVQDCQFEKNNCQKDEKNIYSNPIMLYSLSSKASKIERCLFKENTSSELFFCVDGNEFNLSDCYFDGNNCPSTQLIGIVLNSGSKTVDTKAYVERNTFSKNKCIELLFLFNDRKDVYIRNNTFVSNECSSEMFYPKYSNTYLENNTIVGNKTQSLSNHDFEYKSFRGNIIFGNQYEKPFLILEGGADVDPVFNIMTLIRDPFSLRVLNSTNIISEYKIDQYVQNIEDYPNSDDISKIKDRSKEIATLFNGKYDPATGVFTPILEEDNGSFAPVLPLITDRLPDGASIRFPRIPDIIKDQRGVTRSDKTCMGAYEIPETINPCDESIDIDMSSAYADILRDEETKKLDNTCIDRDLNVKFYLPGGCGTEKYSGVRVMYMYSNSKDVYSSEYLQAKQFSNADMYEFKIPYRRGSSFIKYRIEVSRFADEDIMNSVSKLRSTKFVYENNEIHNISFSVSVRDTAQYTPLNTISSPVQVGEFWTVNTCESKPATINDPVISICKEIGNKLTAYVTLVGTKSEGGKLTLSYCGSTNDSYPTKFNGVDMLSPDGESYYAENIVLPDGSKYFDYYITYSVEDEVISRYGNNTDNIIRINTDDIDTFCVDPCNNVRVPSHILVEGNDTLSFEIYHRNSNVEVFLCDENGVKIISKKLYNLPVGVNNIKLISRLGLRNKDLKLSYIRPYLLVLKIDGRVSSMYVYLDRKKRNK